MRLDIDHAHLTTEHIDELRKGLDTGVPDKAAQPDILRRDPCRRRMFRIVHGGPKFQHLETAPAASYAGLPIQNGPGALPFDASATMIIRGKVIARSMQAIATSPRRLI